MKHIRIIALVVWVSVSVAALWVVEAYKATPGSVGRTPALERVFGAEETDRPQLLMFVHPKCPCSRASLLELQEVMAQAPDAALVEVIFVRPKDVPSGWEQTPLWTAAAQLSGVRVISDDSGARARRFGAQTSGHVVLYDAQGSLLFSGGITRSRGHQGDNAGRQAVLAALRGLPVIERTLPVFGCPLFTSEEAHDRTSERCQNMKACCQQ